MDYRQQIQAFADECIRCGLCTHTDCGNYAAGTPNLGEVCESLLSGDETWRHFPFTCALCGRCTAHCPKGLQAVSGMKPARALILENHPELRPNYRHFRTDYKHNLFSLLQGLQQGDIEEAALIQGEPMGDEAADATAYFPGCSLNSYSPELSDATFQWLRKQGYASRKLNMCCGATFFDCGFFKEFEDYRTRAVALLKDLGIKRIIINCPHCGYVLPTMLEGTDIELTRLTKLMVDDGMKVPGTGTYSVHDACYDRIEGCYGAEVREMFSNWELVPLAHEGRDTICCGGGGMVSAYAPDYCAYRRNQRLAEIDEVESDLLVSTCFSCVNSMQRGDSTKPVKHYLQLLFDMEVDWNEVYSSVDRMYAHPKAAELLAGTEPLL